MLKAVIFDLDGTIADTLDDIGDGLNGMLTEKGFPKLTRNDVLNNINNGAFALVRRSLPEEYRCDNDFIAECLKIYEKYYTKCYSNKTYPYDGIIDAITKLKSQGLKLAVLSNKQDEFTKNIVKKIFPDGTFDIVLGQGRFPAKPSSEAVMYICQQLCVSPKHTAMVGDSHIDMQTAINASLLPVGVTWGYRSREVLIDNGAKVLIDEPSGLIALSDENIVK